MKKTINRLSWNAESFLKENLNLIEEDNFKDFYDKAYSKMYATDIGNLTHFFLETEINPLLYMDEVPRYYLGKGYSKVMDPISNLIPKSITSFGVEAFSYLWWLSFYIPSNVVEVKNAAFYNSYIINIHLSEGLKSIGGSAFAHSSLEEVTIPNSVENLGFRCFCFCDELKKVVIGSNVKDLKDNQFGACMKLDDVTYKGTIQQLEEILGYAFADCYALKEIKCSDGVYKLK